MFMFIWSSLLTHVSHTLRKVQAALRIENSENKTKENQTKLANNQN